MNKKLIILHQFAFKHPVDGFAPNLVWVADHPRKIFRDWLRDVDCVGVANDLMPVVVQLCYSAASDDINLFQTVICMMICSASGRYLLYDC